MLVRWSLSLDVISLADAVMVKVVVSSQYSWLSNLPAS